MLLSHLPSCLDDAVITSHLQVFPAETGESDILHVCLWQGLKCHVVPPCTFSFIENSPKRDKLHHASNVASLLIPTKNILCQDLLIPCIFIIGFDSYVHKLRTPLAAAMPGSCRHLLLEWLCPNLKNAANANSLLGWSKFQSVTTSRNNLG